MLFTNYMYVAKLTVHSRWLQKFCYNTSDIVLPCYVKISIFAKV